MGRYTALAVVVVLAVGGGAAAKKQKVRADQEREPKVKGSTTLHLRSIDLDKRRVLVEVGGLSKPPLGNFFTFTDERGRHFVATNVVCQEPFPSGTQACDLEIPPGYEKHRMVSLLLHLHGLHGKPVEAEPAEVAAAWDAAVAQQGAPQPSPSPSPSPSAAPAASPSPSP